MSEVDRRGGMLAVTESGWIESRLAEQAYRTQNEIERGEHSVVGVNVFTDAGGEGELEGLFQVDPSVERQQRERLSVVKRSRDKARLTDALAQIADEAAGTGNLLPSIITAVKADASEGEIFAAMRKIWGEYRPPGLY